MPNKLKIKPKRPTGRPTTNPPYDQLPKGGPRYQKPLPPKNDNVKKPKEPKPTS